MCVTQRRADTPTHGRVLRVSPGPKSFSGRPQSRPSAPTTRANPSPQSPAGAGIAPAAPRSHLRRHGSRVCVCPPCGGGARGACGRRPGSGAGTRRKRCPVPRAGSQPLPSGGSPSPPCVHPLPTHGACTGLHAQPGPTSAHSLLFRERIAAGHVRGLGLGFGGFLGFHLLFPSVPVPFPVPPGLHLSPRCRLAAAR